MMRAALDRRIVSCALGFLLAAVSQAAAASPPYGPIPHVKGPATWGPTPLAVSLASPGIITNGGFETGNFTGWTVVNQAGSSGDWFVYSGTAAPFSGATIAAPPQGNFAATTDQIGPGSHILYQDVALAPSGTHTLTFILYYLNQAGAFFTPPSLDYTVVPNQQYRVDVMDPSAPVDSVAPGDVLVNLFQTNVGDPVSLVPTAMTFDLTPFAGQTIRLRFAEVDNQSFFEASVDAVAITGGSTVPVPTLGPVGLAAAVLALLAIGTFRILRRQRQTG
jgi:hypothetical protein